MQEPIISEELFDRVQELRSHKRRNTKTGRASLFAGLLFCPDCGAKLHFCAAKSLKPNQEFYRCANYNSGRGTCNIHYIRNVVLEQIVAEAVGNLADFVRCYEPIFLYLLAKNNTAARQSEVQKLKQVITTSERRIQAIDKAIEGLFEANISGKITDERFTKMTANYEKEQKELLKLVADGKKKLLDAEQTKVDLRLLMKALRDYTDIRQLTPEIEDHRQRFSAALCMPEDATLTVRHCCVFCRLNRLFDCKILMIPGEYLESILSIHIKADEVFHDVKEAGLLKQSYKECVK